MFYKICWKVITYFLRELKHSTTAADIFIVVLFLLYALYSQNFIQKKKPKAGQQTKNNANSLISNLWYVFYVVVKFKNNEQFRKMVNTTKNFKNLRNCWEMLMNSKIIEKVYIVEKYWKFDKGLKCTNGTFKVLKKLL